MTKANLHQHALSISYESTVTFSLKHIIIKLFQEQTGFPLAKQEMSLIGTLRFVHPRIQLWNVEI